MDLKGGMSMIYPKLVRKCDCKIPVEIHFYFDELDENGQQLELTVLNEKCNYQEETKNEITDRSNISKGIGKIYLRDDIIPQYNNINDGYVVILGNKRQIKQVVKSRNPDGTVNYLRIDVV